MDGHSAAALAATSRFNNSVKDTTICPRKSTNNEPPWSSVMLRTALMILIATVCLFSPSVAVALAAGVSTAVLAEAAHMAAGFTTVAGARAFVLAN
jgi:uncharacterized membrane protein HdeD (DUF308 family)